MASVSAVARWLGVDRDTVKAWTQHFAEHLSLAGSPPKGQAREFNEHDLRVLALISQFWEDDHDLEYVHGMLNSGEHHDDRFVEFARSHSPLFQEVPDGVDESWRHGVIIGGMASPRDLLEVAKTYKQAADELVAAAISRLEAHEVHYPILFLYRHTIELYLKAMLDTPPEHHDLKSLMGLLEKPAGKKVADWVGDRVRDFHEIDKRSDLFRYADWPGLDELWVDLNQLKEVMDRLVAAFESFIVAQKRDQRRQATAPST